MYQINRRGITHGKRTTQIQTILTKTQTRTQLQTAILIHPMPMNRARIRMRTRTRFRATRTAEKSEMPYDESDRY